MASWTTPPTFVDSVGLSAAELNAYLRDNVQYLYDRVANTSVMLDTNRTTTSGSFSTVTGLTFPVVSGTFYNIFGLVWASSSSTANGFAFSFDHPGGTCTMLATYAGESSDASQDHEWQNATDTGTGVATVNTADRRYPAQLRILYQCTSSGTFSLRYKRNTGGTVTVYAGSGLRVDSV